MSEMRFHRRPGGVAVAELEPPDSGAAVLLGPPDFVVLPPQLGGIRANILREFWAPDPRTGEGNVSHYEVEGGYGVAECYDQFVWYRMPSAEEA